MTDTAAQTPTGPDAGATFYHGTRADLSVGDLLAAGWTSNYATEKPLSWIYFSAALESAVWGCELAVGPKGNESARERIYIVQPTGDWFDDPNLTDKKFPGNPTRSYRSRSPLRITGEVGQSLYRAARAAGAPARAVEAYLRAIGSKTSVGGIGSNARFDLIIAQRRAETGEVETGELLYAGLDQGRRKLQLLKWQAGGRTEWFDAAGVGEKRKGLTRPVAGRQTSGFGMRFHPLLGYSRLHKGTDFGASTGTPIYAVSDGTVTFSGRHGGHGNYVKLRHGGNMSTGYAHMSRIAVRSGQHVRQGQVIGYVGSTGLSTGPHLHFEVYRGSTAINPKSVSFVSTSLLSGEQLRAFRTKLANLLATPAR
jgi:murein DD-endopeptidase MepM/ murein hydrolase activator NlpD